MTFPNSGLELARVSKITEDDFEDKDEHKNPRDTLTHNEPDLNGE